MIRSGLAQNSLLIIVQSEQKRKVPCHNYRSKKSQPYLAQETQLFQHPLPACSFSSSFSKRRIPEIHRTSGTEYAVIRIGQEAYALQRISKWFIRHQRLGSDSSNRRLKILKASLAGMIHKFCGKIVGKMGKKRPILPTIFLIFHR